MKTNPVHIFEFLQQMQESPHDQSLRTKFDFHTKECAECRENLVLFHDLQIASRDKPIETKWNKLSNPQMVTNVKKRIQHRRYIPDLLRPLPGLAWITLIILLVVLLNWGITRLRTVNNVLPANLNLQATHTITPTKIYSGVNDCRTIVYKVEEKNTLLAIADYFNVAIYDIWKENNLGNGSVFKPGISLLIPFCGWSPVLYTYDLNSVTPICDCPLVQYTIQQGDTLEMISTAFNVPVATIVTENQLGNSSVLFPGESLVVPLCKIP